MPANNTQGYIRFPTIFGDRIVFTAEDDLWSVSTSGGRAERLTAGVAEATHACFSPDGSLLAFVGRDEGPAEVYVMPAEGGPARRLTYQGDNAAVVGWRPDGSTILYVSAAGQPARKMRALQSISRDGGEPSLLPYGAAHSIAFGPHGALVIGRNTAEPARWKRYRGGTAGYLWVDPTGDGEFRRLLDLPGNVAYPCWVGERIYFISDHEGIGNVYSCLPTGKDVRRHTQQTEYYVRGLSTDGRRLVYHAGGDLYLLEPDRTDGGAQLDVTLASARAQRARKFVPAAKYLDSWQPHPKGHAVTLTTRGKAFSMGNWEGAVTQHGEADGVRYRLMAWLADGKRLVAVGDDGTEPRLTVFSADGSAPDRTLDKLDIGHVLEIRPSPVGEQVALRNHRNEFVLVDVAAETLRVVDRSPSGREEDVRRMHGLAWAPDGQWLAYAFRINPQQTAIKLCRVETGETYQITEPVLNDLEPAFDPAGRYLYFIGMRDFDPVQDNAHFEWSFPKTMRPYLVTLRRDLRSPFMPSPEAPKDELAEELEEAKAKERKEKETRPAPVAIDLEGITTRVVAFPVPEGRYGRVQGTHEGVVFSSFPVEGTRKKPIMELGPEANGSLEAYHFEQRKQEHLADGIDDFDVTADGKTLLYRAGERLRSVKAGEKPPQGEDLPPNARDKPGRETGWIDLERVKVSIRPESEWRQMFGEAWRLQREQFWVADMGGVDWKAIYDRYAPLVDRVGSRGELSDLFWELQGELGSSHAYEFGGEYRRHPEYRQGFLGVDWRFDPTSGRYTISQIIRGDPWDASATSPLLAPGVNVGVGDSIVAINGQRVSAERSPQQLLVNQAASEVQLVVEPVGGGPERTVIVRALADEHLARYRDWVEANRRLVREATGGRVGYIHLPDMAFDGFAEYHRQYLLEYDRDSLIVDVRWNSGGMVSGLLLEKLARKRLGYDFQRWGPPTPYFKESPRGPLVALTDENAGSDGDIFSHAFKMLGLGPLIGKRTWGGVVGIDPYMALVDGTITTQPEFSFWFNDVGWGVENYGTDPTIEVDYPPQAYAAGKDPQLERAIEEALRLVAEHPAPTPTPGPHPNRGYPRHEG
jgi:tricorn protease